jgi:hypothetical protein
MDFDWQKFVNPAQFSNANYITDLNPSGGMASVRDTVASSMGIPVKPPGEAPADQSFGQMVQGAVAPHMNRFQQAQNTFTKVGNAVSNALPSLPSLNPPAPASSGEQYDHNW